jgi:hypothetical protein
MWLREECERVKPTGELNDDASNAPSASPRLCVPARVLTTVLAFVNPTYAFAQMPGESTEAQAEALPFAGVGQNLRPGLPWGSKQRVSQRRTTRESNRGGGQNRKTLIL